MHEVQEQSSQSAQNMVNDEVHDQPNCHPPLPDCDDVDDLSQSIKVPNSSPYNLSTISPEPLNSDILNQPKDHPVFPEKLAAALVGEVQETLSHQIFIKYVDKILPAPYQKQNLARILSHTDRNQPT